MLRHAFVWYLPATPEGRRAFAAARVAEGCTEVAVKAFGDGGVRWLRQFPRPSWAAPQWDAAYLDDLAPLSVTLWGYPLPNVDAESDAIVDCVREHNAREIILNPETEWRVQSARNTFKNLAEANHYAESWVRILRSRLLAELGWAGAIAFSSVPTWADFPYEGFAAACDVAYPQDYWPDNAFPWNDGETGEEAGEDEVEAHIRRAGRDLPCVPIVTACGEYDDNGVRWLAQGALADFPQLDGLSAWESGNAAYQGQAVKDCYAMLPADEVRAQAGPAAAGDPGFPGALQPDGTVRLGEVDFGGVSACVEEVTVRTRNAKGERYERTWAGHALRPWVVR